MSKFNSGRFKETRGSRADLEATNSKKSLAGGAGSNTYPNDTSKIGHIFGNRGGHMTDTPAHRAELLAVANDSTCYLGEDSRGNHWFARTNTDGSQTWVVVRSGTIRNGGKNVKPRPWDKRTGLSANPFKEQ